MKKFVFNKAEISLIDEENNIILFKITSQDKFTLEDTKEFDKAYIELCQRKPFLSIVDVRKNFATSSPEAKIYIAQKAELTKYRIASAWVITNIASKLIVSTYIHLNKPNCPTKIFDNMDKAKEWLLKFKTQS